MASGVDTILVVEDNDTTAQMLMLFLSSAGYRVVRVERGSEAIAAIDQQTALVLLDLMLPDVDGIELCKRIRASSGPPVLMLTARVSEDDVVEGLQSGADDYVCKPYSPREVVARVKSVLRRAQPAASPPAMPTVGGRPLEIDRDARQARVAGKSLELTPKEFRLLQVLAARPGRVFSRAQLLDAIYEDQFDVSERAIDSHLKNLRRKLAQAFPDDEPIRSIYGVGFAFES